MKSILHSIKQKNIAISLLLCSILFGGWVSNSSVYAESATGHHDQTDQSAEVIAAKKIIDQHLGNDTKADDVSSTDANQGVTPLTAASEKSTNFNPANIPQLNQPIIDPSNVLSSSEKATLNQFILNLYQAGKAQIGVVIVPSIGQDDIFNYAMRIAQQWQLGEKKYDNGLLIVVAVNDQKIQILTGYGLEGVLPDIVIHQIIQQQITPAFKNQHYAEGLQAGLNEINRILSLDPDIAKQQADVLKQQQATAHDQQQAQSKAGGILLLIILTGIFISYAIGRKLSAMAAGGAAIATGLICGVGLKISLIYGVVIFFLIISSIAQLVLQMILSGAGRGGGGSGGSSGGGYRGGGGGFGGGGASGSW